MTITLAVTERDEKTTADSLRSNGNVPAVVYGPKQEPITVSLEAKAFEKVRQEAGESTIIELKGLKEEVEVLIKEIDFDPVKQQVIHVDLYAIERGKEMTTKVSLEFINEAPAEVSKVGTVNKVLHEVEVTCKPKDLPNHIDVDLSTLVTLEDKIFIKDLKVASGVIIEAEADEPVVVVNAVKEEVEEEPVEAVDMDEIEVEQKGKGEEEAETETKE